MEVEGFLNNRRGKVGVRILSSGRLSKALMALSSGASSGGPIKIFFLTLTDRSKNRVVESVTAFRKFPIFGIERPTAAITKRRGSKNSRSNMPF